MILKVKKDVLLFSLLSFLYFFPGFMDNAFISLIRNLLFAMTIVYILLHRIKPDCFILSVITYYLALHVITLVNGHVYSDAIVLNIKACIYIWLLKGLLEKDTRKTVNILYYIILFFCVINFLTVVLMPEGLYQTREFIDVWNGYYVYGNWIFGNKNTQSNWYLLLILLCYVRASTYKNSKKITLWIIAIISVLNMVLVESSTSAFVLMIAAVAVVLLSGKNRIQYPDMNSHSIFAGYLLVETLLVSGMLTIVGPFIQTVFGKDLTFSGRATSVWPKVLLYIEQKMLCGHGLINANTASELMQNIALVNAHNEVLQILWQGGVLLLFVVILAFHNIGNAINEIQDKREKIFICALLVAYLTSTLFEVTSSGYVFLIFIALLYYSPKLMRGISGKETASLVS